MWVELSPTPQAPAFLIHSDLDWRRAAAQLGPQSPRLGTGGWPRSSPGLRRRGGKEAETAVCPGPSRSWGRPVAPDFILSSPAFLPVTQLPPGALELGAQETLNNYSIDP